MDRALNVARFDIKQGTVGRGGEARVVYSRRQPCENVRLRVRRAACVRVQHRVQRDGVNGGRLHNSDADFRPVEAAACDGGIHSREELRRRVRVAAYQRILRNDCAVNTFGVYWVDRRPCVLPFNAAKLDRRSRL